MEISLLLHQVDVGDEHGPAIAVYGQDDGQAQGDFRGSYGDDEYREDLPGQQELRDLVGGEVCKYNWMESTGH